MISINSIVRGTLLSEGLTMHYYLPFLHFAMECLSQELNLDTLGAIKTYRGKVNNFNEVDLPSDYIDYSKIGYERSGRFIKMFENNALITLPKVDEATASQAKYDTGSGIGFAYALANPYYYNSSYNQYAENLGGVYGLGLGNRADQFKIILDRRKILVGSLFTAGDIINMEYIGQPDYASNDALVPDYAATTIQCYIRWKFSMSRPGLQGGAQAMKKQEYYQAYRILRGRLYGITLEQAIEIDRENTRMSIK